MNESAQWYLAAKSMDGGKTWPEKKMNDHEQIRSIFLDH